MNYKELELSLEQKLYFYFFISFLGLVIGWTFFDSIVIGAALAIMLKGLEGEYRNHLHTKRKQELLLQFKDFLYSLASSVSTGRSIRQGIQESYYFWQGTYQEDDYIMLEISSFIEKMNKSNADEIILLEDFARRSGLRDIEDMAMAARVCKKTGSDLSKALQECSAIIGDKITLEKELRSLMIQKRFEGYIIASAPVLLMVMIKLISPEYLKPLTQSYTGMFISTISLLMIVIAWVYIERVNRIEI